MIDNILLTATCVYTYNQDTLISNASGFFFERHKRLYLVTSRHVLIDEESHHHPDRISIELHTEADNLVQCIGFSILLYKEGKAIWVQGEDGGGDVDVAVIEIDRNSLPESAVYKAFTEEHLQYSQDQVPVGSPLAVVGFPLGFHDTLHHFPVVRHAIVASSYGLRFQGKGYFLTDGRMHRGSSGAPVAMRVNDLKGKAADIPWLLLGIHSGRMDMQTRDVEQDEFLGLNCTWYADILLTLTE
ncbi:S1 family peptidase [Hahella ganghwensis]|uniref:S1 family peptidase n=1 Tax=Hahella ganghwensis TaxID=286420 RepID=UPI000360F8CD|nr:serine protease [Hahella ganghwensis]